MSAKKNASEFATSYFEWVSDLARAIDPASIDAVAAIFKAARDREATIYFLGNGGSAATATHATNDLCKCTRTRGGKPFRALSLSDNAAWVSALANDEGYDMVFAGQLDNLLRSGDIVFGISASGNSINLLRAFELASERGATTVALVGFDGGRMMEIADASIHVVSEHGAYEPVEDVHLIVMHMLTSYLSTPVDQGGE